MGQKTEALGAVRHCGWRLAPNTIRSRSGNKDELTGARKDGEAPKLKEEQASNVGVISN